MTKEYKYAWEDPDEINAAPTSTEEQKAAYIMANLLAYIIMRSDERGWSLLGHQDDVFYWLSQQWKRDPWKINLWTHDRMKRWQRENGFEE